MKVVAFGGGHGLFASLEALKRLDAEITAVVTVADDGGSSGRLRQECDFLPPGDLRQALVALSAEECAETAQLWQHRYASAGSLKGHAVGNLILAGLFEKYTNPVEALAHAGRMLKLRGRVFPMAQVPLEIEADVDGVGVVRGQSQVAVAPGRVRTVRIIPEDPPVCPSVIEAVEQADWLFFGPGSWFTSVVPHLLVPQLRKAIAASAARRVVILNLSSDAETVGFSGVEHLDALLHHDKEFRCDMILVDSSMNGDSEDVMSEAEKMGGRVVVAPIAVAAGVPRHNPDAVAAALANQL